MAGSPSSRPARIRTTASLAFSILKSFASAMIIASLKVSAMLPGSRANRSSPRSGTTASLLCSSLTTPHPDAPEGAEAWRLTRPETPAWRSRVHLREVDALVRRSDRSPILRGLRARVQLLVQVTPRQRGTSGGALGEQGSDLLALGCVGRPGR